VANRFVLYLFSLLLSCFYSRHAISQINGVEGIDYVTRKTCIEVFTGIWCGPCHFSNIDLRYNVLPNIENYTIVEYHIGPDVFATGEGQNRASYYNLSYVPAYIFDGRLDTCSVTKFENYQQQIAYLKIDIENAFHSDSEAYVSGKIVSLKNFSSGNYKLRIIVTEIENTQHPNGWDTSYYDISIKMSPSEVGTVIINPIIGIPIYFNEVIPIETTHIQNIDNLKVIVLVQNETNYQIEQSEWRAIKSSSTISFPLYDVSKITVFPNPANEFIVVRNCGEEANIHLYNSIGRECLISPKKHEKSMIVDIHNLPLGVYYISVSNYVLKFIKAI
jgi:hypothetical protein